MGDDADVVIIGGGPAGLTAGIYAARAGLRTVILEKMVPGGQLTTTDVLENYPGFVEPISGFELAEHMKEQAGKYGAKVLTGEAVAVEKSKSTIAVGTKDSEILALSVIVASGASPRRLGVKGEEKFWGRGISCCATCDGRFYKDKHVVVVGGGDTAAKESLFLTRFAGHITLVHRRGMLRATKVLQDRLFEMKDKVDFCWHSVVTEIRGDKTVQEVEIKNIETEEKKVIKTDGVFIFVGFKPNTDFLSGIVDMDERGYILTDEEMKTSAEGIFACGDARKKLLRQVVTACGEGATAAFAAQHYVDEKKGNVYA